MKCPIDTTVQNHSTLPSSGRSYRCFFNLAPQRTVEAQLYCRRRCIPIQVPHEKQSVAMKRGRDAPPNKHDHFALELWESLVDAALYTCDEKYKARRWCSYALIAVDRHVLDTVQCAGCHVHYTSRTRSRFPPTFMQTSTPSGFARDGDIGRGNTTQAITEVSDPRGFDVNRDGEIYRLGTSRSRYSISESQFLILRYLL